MKIADRMLLPDGRWIGFTVYGPSDGEPVFYFHGMRSCRLDVDFASAACDQAGIRLIAVDRPGIGASEFQPSRRLVDWANDVLAIADNLGVGRFALLAWSAGCPYALACAYMLGERISRIGIVAGLAPFDRTRTPEQLGLAFDRMLFRMADRSPDSAAFRLNASRRLPSLLLRRGLLKGLKSPADRSLVRSLPPQEIVGPFREALLYGATGTVLDYRILGGWWGFELEPIETDVHLWHGEKDQVIPPSHAEWLSSRLPKKTLHLVPGEGHFLLRTHLKEILSTVAGVPRSDS